MHWLIPLVSHSLSGLLAWRGGTVTFAALLVSFLIAASQSIHLWAIFYGLFALVFVAGTCQATITRYRSRQPAAQDGQTTLGRRNAAFLLTNLVVVSALVPLHTYYLKHRMTTVPWFHIYRARTGCLPIPSRTLTEPFKYTWVDALGNQLPYGIVFSYAATMACSFSFSVGDRSTFRGLSTFGTIFGALGALTVALAAAYGLPMCGGDDRDGSHQVTTHVDRSFDWKERTAMAWSSEARYGTFVVLITLAGTTAAVIAAQMTATLQNSKIHTQAVKTLTQPEKQASILSDKKQQAQSEKASQTKAASMEQTSISGNADDKASTLASSSLLLPLCVNLLLTAAVIIGMAVWSWTGPRKEQDGLDFPGAELLNAAMN